MTYLAHIILNVSDMEKSKDFYDALMNALAVPSREVHNDEEIKIIAYDLPKAPIYIRWARNEKHEVFVRNIGLDHICIGVESKEDVDRVYKVVTELGTVVTKEPKAYPDYTENYYAFYFRDPDGIPLEVAYI